LLIAPRIVSVAASRGEPCLHPSRDAAHNVMVAMRSAACDPFRSDHSSPESTMRHLAAAAALVLSIAACNQGTPSANGAANIEDPDVRRVHSRMMDAMGGARGWERARYFEFDWVVVRGGEEAARWSHRWDRYTGEHRVEGVRAGEPVVVRMNVNDPEGPVRAWLSGEAVSDGARLDSLRSFAYSRFINDSYWLIMPYKWTDPGVHLSYEGEREEAGREWDVVRLTFDDVGLTPQNQYLAYISPESGLMERWYHFSRADAEPSISDWTAWREFGPIRLATEKPNAAGTGMIRFDNVRVETRVPDGAFDD
jgi:hypothetical protein